MVNRLRKKRLFRGFETVAFFIVENPLRSFTFAVEKTELRDPSV